MIAILVLGYYDKRKNENRVILGVFIQVMIPGFIDKYKIITAFFCHNWRDYTLKTV
jgi:hypothetical protein